MPVIHKEISASAAPERTNPAHKRQRRHIKNSPAIGITSWNLNSPKPTRTPAPKSRCCSSMAKAAASNVRRMIESCPCISATQTGMKAGSSSSGNHRQRWARLFVQGRKIRATSTSRNRFTAINEKYACAYDRNENGTKHNPS